MIVAPVTESGGLVGFLSDPRGWGDHWWTVTVRLVVDWWLVGGAALGVPAMLVAWIRLAVRKTRTTKALRDARMIEILVPPAVDVASATAFWANLHGLMRPVWRRFWAGQPHLAFEYIFDSSGFRIGLWVPGTLPPGMIEPAVEAAWPGAQVETEPAVPPIPVGPAFRPARMLGGRLRLARLDIHPLRDRFAADPLRPLLGAAARLNPSEIGCVQVLARPVTGRRLRRYRKALRGFRKAPPTGTSMKSTVLDLTLPGSGRPTAVLRADVEHSADVRATLTKSIGPLWETVVHYAAATTAPLPASRWERATERGRLRGRAHAYASAFAIHAERNWWARKRVRQLGPALAERRFVRGDLLSLAELAALAHLPFDEAAPGISRSRARTVAPPGGIPAPSRQAKPVGQADAGSRRAVALDVAGARHHLHIVGKTGCGKSSLLANLALADVEAGRGTIVIDPKGDLVTDLLHRLPEHAVERTVLIDPDHDGARPALNLLAVRHPREIPFVVDNVVSTFHRIYGGSWGPRTEDILRSVILTLLKGHDLADPPTLADVPKLLQAGESERRAMVRGLRDPLLQGFWEWYGQLSEPARAHTVAPLMNKMRAFLLRDFVRETVAARSSTFAMSDILDGGVLLARLPKGLLGDETMRLLGSLLVVGAWQAATNRVRQIEERRRDCSLYLDEGHNFLSLAIGVEEMLAEARGYRLSMTIAHQNLAQLSVDLREALSANARSKVFFTASPEDSRAMERHVAPFLGAYDLANLGRFQAAARLVSGGDENSAFTVRTLPMPAAIPGRAAQVRTEVGRRWPAEPHDVGAPAFFDPRSMPTPRCDDLTDTLELSLDSSFWNAGGDAA